MRASLAFACLLGCISGCDRLFPYSAGVPSGEPRPGDSPHPGLDGPRPEQVRRPDGLRAPDRPRAVDHSRAGDSGPVCTPVPAPAAYCADELGCLMACKQSSTCCYQKCLSSTGGALFKDLFFCLVSGVACGSQCSSIASASCLGCLESTCASQLKACVADRPSLGSALNCAEWLACVLSCKGGATPGACVVVTCGGSVDPASQAATDSLKLCGQTDCKGCVDPTQVVCVTGTLLGCLRQNNSCTGPLETCWKDYK